MNEIERILQSVELILKKVKPTQFSDGGWVRLNVKIKQFVSELIKESNKVAKKRKADSVSFSFVNHAYEYLTSGRASRAQKIWQMVGNFFLGVGATLMVSMALKNQYSTGWVLFTLVLLVIGAIAFCASNKGLTAHGRMENLIPLPILLASMV